MTTVADMLELVESLAPVRLAEDWDNVGLMVGDLQRKVSRVLLALDADLNTIRAAADRKADLLLTHHPLIFRPLKNMNLDDPVPAALAAAITSGLNVISAHTNLDAAADGVNDALARRLRLSDIRPLAPNPDDPDAGLGRLGRIPGGMSAEAFLNAVNQALGVKARLAGAATDDAFETAAVLGGSGGGFLSLARGAGADVLVTGDVGYHQAREAEISGPAVIDAGHFATERPVLEPWADRLAQTLENRRWPVTLDILTSEKEPWWEV